MDVISIHDRYQFEMKQSHAFMPGPTDMNTEIYFFFPKTLNITRVTFSKDEYFESSRNFIRLQTPDFTLEEVADGSGYDSIEQMLEEYKQKPSEKNAKAFEYNLKMLGSILRSSLKNYVVEFGINSENRNARLDEYCQLLHQLSGRLRSLGNKVILEKEPILRNSIRFCDEYLSLLIEHFTYRLLDRFQESKQPLDTAAKERLLGMVNEEIDYRKRTGYPSIPRENSDNEDLIYRRSVLKKYVQSALHLDMNVNRDDGILRQVIFALAAGVAMSVTLMILFYFQSRYGALSFPFFLAAAISYMFKDRIKSLSRAWLVEWAGHWLYDHKTRILSRSGQKLGICRESFDFVRPNQVPSSVMQARDGEHFTEIENELRGEDIIRYRRRIRVNSEKIRHIYSASRLNGLVDMLRLNVRRFLVAMDEPEEPLNLTDGKEYHRVSGSRTYHVNLVVCGDAGAKRSCRRYRIVLTRNGIKRIEQMLVDRNISNA